jgi:hypothetical protein
MRARITGLPANLEIFLRASLSNEGALFYSAGPASQHMLIFRE